MENYKDGMANEITALRKQVQDQTLKIDEMRRSVENINTHIPVDIVNVSPPCYHSLGIPDIT